METERVRNEETNYLTSPIQDYKSHKEETDMCMGGRDPAPAPRPEPIPQPVINASPIGDTLAPELQIADESMDDEALKRRKRRRGTSQLNTQLTSGLNIPATSSGINVA